MTPKRSIRGRLALLAGAAMLAPLAALAQGAAEGPATLSDAIARAQGGGEVVLPPGDYGALELRGKAWPAGRPLVLRAADPANPPRFSRLALSGVENVVLDGLLFDYSFAPGDPGHARPFQIEGSRGVTVRDARFDGDVARGVSPTDDGFGNGWGLNVSGSRDVTIEDSEIEGFLRGLVVGRSQDVTVRGNDLHGLRMDGMNFVQVERVLIEGNQIHDFARSVASDDHPDMIQFWTTRSTAPSRDVVIRDNLLNSGHGAWTQSIFMRNEEVDQGRAGRGMFYQDVTIEGNLIINAHLNGIAVGETAGLSILDNTVVRNPGSEGPQDNPDLWTPQVRVSPASTDVRIRGNVASQVSGAQGQPGWDVEGNLVVQDRTRMAPGFYPLVFVGGDPADPASFAALPGGPLDGAGIGSPLPESFR